MSVFALNGYVLNTTQPTYESLYSYPMLGNTETHRRYLLETWGGFTP